jgi:hypothetical protein
LPPRPLFRLLLTISLLVPLAVFFAPAAAYASDPVGYLIDHTQAARADHGLSSYVVSSDLMSVAQHQAEAEAARREPYHNPSLGSDVCCWAAVGENVGEGPSASSVQQAFMGSSEHRDNILSTTYTQMGIGAARGGDGRLYVDEVFREPNGSGGSSSTHHHHRHRVDSQSAAPAPATRAPAPASRSQTRSPLVSLPPTFHQLVTRALRAFRPPAHPVDDPVAAVLQLSAVMSRLRHR